MGLRRRFSHFKRENIFLFTREEYLHIIEGFCTDVVNNGITDADTIVYEALQMLYAENGLYNYLHGQSPVFVDVYYSDIQNYLKNSFGVIVDMFDKDTTGFKWGCQYDQHGLDKLEKKLDKLMYKEKVK